MESRKLKDVSISRTVEPHEERYRKALAESERLRDTLERADAEIRRLLAIFARLHLLANFLPGPHAQRIHDEIAEALESPKESPKVSRDETLGESALVVPLDRGDGKALEATEAALADWLMRRCGLELSPLSIHEGAQQILAAHYDALLSELPEEAVEAAMKTWSDASIVRSDAAPLGSERFHQKMAAANAAFLLSLRSSNVN